ncbi:MAG TPA: alpha-E domain-containing protein [Solirubrobacteraceae bacterium]|nr:alpha-E domain-containing protein [Solirubrobacteraceae bacterium]
MLARIAHELFWLGRNLARAEHTARMLDGVFQATLQGRPDDPAGVTLDWSSMLAIMGAPRGNAPARRDEVLRALTLEPDNPTSVIACIGRAREGARTVRDVISAEMWEAVNTTNLTLVEGDLSARLRSGPYSVYGYVKERCALFWGLTSRTMLRDEASAFLAAGGRIESADMVLRMLRVALPPDVSAEPSTSETGQALALLQAVGGFQAYRRAVPAPPNALPVARFLVFERTYPDSVAASVDAVHTALSRADGNPRNSEPVLRLQRLSADLEFRGRAEAAGGDLHATCEAVQEELVRVDRDIADRYFAGAVGLLMTAGRRQ